MKNTSPEDLRSFTGRIPRVLLPPWRRTLLRLAGL
jgi:hypothetical protein